MLCYKQEVQVEWSHQTVTLQIFKVIGLYGNRCYLHITLQSLTPLFKICHVLTLCISSFLLQDWLLREKV